MLSLLLEIDQSALQKSLNILWQGLVAMLAVVGVIMSITYLMQYVSKKISASKDRKPPADSPDEDNRK